MRKIIELTIANIFISLLQTAFFLELFGAVNPNLVLANAYSYFYGNSIRTSLISAFVGGLIIDLLGVGIVGITPLFFVIAILLSDFIKKYIFRGWITNIISLSVASAGYTILSNYPSPVNTHDNLVSVFLTLAFSFVFYFLNRAYTGLVANSSFSLR